MKRHTWGLHKLRSYSRCSERILFITTKREDEHLLLLAAMRFSSAILRYVYHLKSVNKLLTAYC